MSNSFHWSFLGYKRFQSKENKEQCENNFQAPLSEIWSSRLWPFDLAFVKEFSFDLNRKKLKNYSKKNSIFSRKRLRELSRNGK